MTNVVSRRGMLAGAAGLTVAGIAGCSSGSSSSSSSSASGSASASGAPSGNGPLEKKSITVATVPAVTNMGLFLAQQEGYFAAEGLTVTMQSVQSSTTAITNQLKGTIDITAGAYISYILAQAQNPSAVSFKILAEGSISQTHSQQVLVAKNSPIQTIADLKGKTVGSNILDNIGTLLVQSVLAENNVPLTSVKLVAVPFPTMAAALDKGEIDAGWFDEPFQSEAQLNDGAKALFDTSQGATTNFPISGYMVTSAWVQKYPNTAAAFVRAIQRGQQMADTSRPAEESAATKFIKGVTPKVASILTFDTYPTGPVDTTRMQRVADVMHQFGLLKSAFNMSSMVTSM